MLHETLSKLREMRLSGMVEALERQRERPDSHSLSFDERLAFLVDQEWSYRQDRRLSRLLKEAKLRLPACLEDVDCSPSRGLDRSTVESLASCEWIRYHQGVVVTGPTGSGKTYLICALANAACRMGYSARYYRLPKLIRELSMAKGDGSYDKLLNKLARVQVLLIDDLGLAPMTETESRELLEVIDERTGRRSTIVASQLPIAEWHATMADPSAADAILDRLVHSAHKIALHGESLRKEQGQQAAGQAGHK